MFSEPAAGERFFGREAVLELLNKRASALKEGYRQNVALAGQSLAGKTSILQHFLRTIREEGYITVYVEVVKEPFRRFANKFIATLLYNALSKSGVPVSAELDLLMEKARDVLPKTHLAVRHVNASVERQEFDEAYSALLGLTSIVREETKASCIVILDEFDNLESLGIKNPFLNFGKVIMVQKDTMYVVSSSRGEAIRKILSEKLSLLFGNFEIVKVPGFDEATSADFIDSRLPGFDVDPAIRTFLVGFTDGNPFYLDRLTERMKALAIDRMSNHADDRLLAQALLDVVYDSSGAIHQYLVNFILDMLDSKTKDTSMAMLAAIALGRNRSSEAARGLRLRQSEASKLLSRLVEAGLLSKNGIFYRIDDAMLEFWLKHIYQARRDLLVDGVFDRAALFRDDIAGYIASFHDDLSRGPAVKVAELFGTFSNELVQIGSKAIRLPHFTRVETRRMDSGGDIIAASLRGKYWMIQVYESEAGETEIIDYMRGIKEMSSAISNKLIIPLRGIDEMAGLLAKELKISIWDLATMNMLLTFYGKRRIVMPL
jgi:Cdc6-like AAA superfamily ATPase